MQWRPSRYEKCTPAARESSYLAHVDGVERLRVTRVAVLRHAPAELGQKTGAAGTRGSWRKARILELGESYARIRAQLANHDHWFAYQLDELIQRRQPRLLQRLTTRVQRRGVSTTARFHDGPDQNLCRTGGKSQDVERADAPGGNGPRIGYAFGHAERDAHSSERARPASDYQPGQLLDCRPDAF